MDSLVLGVGNVAPSFGLWESLYLPARIDVYDAPFNGFAECMGQEL